MTPADALASLSRARVLVARSTTADRVADALREEVVEGRLRPGERLPEQDVCVALAVSRNTVREAMSRLVAERVLVRESHRGVFVARPDHAAVRDLYRARRVIEPAAVRIGGPHSAHQVAGVRATVDEGLAAAATGDWAGVASANQHFHRALVGLAGSARLDQQMALLLAEMRLMFHRMPGAQEFHKPYLAGNEAICRQLEEGDRTGAADAVSEYLDTAQAQLLAAYDALAG